jgi:CheY-like chemotaxis protein
MTDERKAVKLILVVDDDPDVRLAFQIRLGVDGYTLIFARDGAAAITEARKYRPDLILLDLGMPAPDGFAVMDNLRELGIPVIIISGRNVIPNRELAFQAGVKAYLQKPVNNDTLLATIKRVLT